MKGFKGQIATEHLALLGTFLALAIPLTLLFITMFAFHKDELEYYNADVALSLVSKAAERAFAECSEENVSHLLSLRLPDNVEEMNITSIEIGGEERLYARAKLKDGSTIMKPIKIDPSTIASGYTISMASPPIRHKVGDVVISCYMDSSRKKIELYMGIA